MRVCVCVCIGVVCVVKWCPCGECVCGVCVCWSGRAAELAGPSGGRLRSVWLLV